MTGVSGMSARIYEASSMILAGLTSIVLHQARLWNHFVILTLLSILLYHQRQGYVTCCLATSLNQTQLLYLNQLYEIIIMKSTATCNILCVIFLL